MSCVCVCGLTPYRVPCNGCCMCVCVIIKLMFWQGKNVDKVKTDYLNKSQYGFDMIYP